MCSHPHFHNSIECLQKYKCMHIPKTSRYTEVSIYTLPAYQPLPSLSLFHKKVQKRYYPFSTSMSKPPFPPYPCYRWLGMEIQLSIHTDDCQPFMCMPAYFKRDRLPVLYVQTSFNTEGLFCGIFILMNRIKVTITLREDLVFDFRGRGLSNLSAVMEELLSAFLSSIPSGTTKRTSKETLELVRNFLSGRSTQAVSSNPQELFQQFMSFLQSQSLPSTSGQPQQSFQPPPPPPPQPQYQPQPQPQPQYQPQYQPPQLMPTVQEPKPKPKISTREILRAMREHAIEHGVPPELVDYERILEEARREAEKE